MQLLKIWGRAYCQTGLCFVLTFYSVTAPPYGPFVFKWTNVNRYFLLSYLVGYPLVMRLAPRLTQPPIHLISLQAQVLKQLITERTTHKNNHRQPALHLDRLLLRQEATDDFMNASLGFVWHGILMLVAFPGLVIILLARLIQKIGRIAKR